MVGNSATYVTNSEREATFWLVVVGSAVDFAQGRGENVRELILRLEA